MEPWWTALLLEQQKNRFKDLGGAKASVTLPISDRLIEEVLRSRLTESVRDLDIRAKAGNVAEVSVRLAKPAWLPRISAHVCLERQPQLPDSPVLVLRLLSHGALASLAGSAARLFDALPPWLRMEGDLVFVDIALLLRKYTAIDVLKYLTRLEVTTSDGSIVLAIDAQVLQQPSA